MTPSLLMSILGGVGRHPLVRTGLITLLAAALFGQVTDARQLQPVLDEPSRLWIQQVLETWETIARSKLRISPEPVPWMIFYDERLAWHLNADVSQLPPGAGLSSTVVVAQGRKYQLHSVPNIQAVWLPAGELLPVGPDRTPRIFAMPYGDGQKSFAAIALPALLRRQPGIEQIKNIDTFFIGAAGHELVHTRQLADVLRRVRELRERHSVPLGVTDNFIQQTFASNAEYVALYSKERDLLFQAAAELDDRRESSLGLISEALANADKRRATFFKGDQAVYRELDDIFLGMEGVAMWVHFQIARAHAPKEESWQTTAMELLKGNTNWVQEEGFALFVLIDRLVPNWQEQFMAPNFPSAFTVLRVAVENAKTPRRK